jgi:hypothetical protein
MTELVAGREEMLEAPLCNNTLRVAKTGRRVGFRLPFADCQRWLENRPVADPELLLQPSDTAPSQRFATSETGR